MAATRLFTVQRNSTNLHEISSEETSVRKTVIYIVGVHHLLSTPLKKIQFKVACSGFPQKSGKMRRISSPEKSVEFLQSIKSLENTKNPGVNSIFQPPIPFWIFLQSVSRVARPIGARNSVTGTMHVLKCEKRWKFYLGIVKSRLPITDVTFLVAQYSTTPQCTVLA